MPLLKILSNSEIAGFDSPPVFNHEERKKFFNLPSGLKSEWETLRTTENKILFLLQFGYFRARQRFFAGHFHLADFEYLSSKFTLSSKPKETLSYSRPTVLRHQHIILEFCGIRYLQESDETLIIDLRGNSGGASDLAPAIANLLSATPGSLGNLKYRYETTPYSYAGAGTQAYKGKIILLTDEGTGSTSEVFAGGLQENKRAILVGSRSAGAVLPSLAMPLPTGGALQHVVSDFRTPKGVPLEAKGITPDLPVKVTRSDLLSGRDPILRSAVNSAKRL
jgi:hypothetical protein